MYGLSFAEEFFSGDGEHDLYEMPTSDRPTNVLQAAISLPLKERIEISREVFGYKGKTAKIHAESEGFGFDVVEKVRETDLCDDLSSPVTVYIDPDQNYSLTIYEEDGPDEPYFVSTD